MSVQSNLKKCVLLCLSMLMIGVLAVSAQDEPVRDWSAVNDYIIQLQRARVDRLAPTAYDLIIADLALAGNSLMKSRVFEKAKAATSWLLLI